MNQGIDLVESKVSHTLGANFENLTLLDDGDLETAEQALGNGGANIIIGNSENNFINGLGGADTMQGGNGDDLYRIDNVGDKIVETDDPGIGHRYRSIRDLDSSSVGQCGERLPLRHRRCQRHRQ